MELKKGHEIDLANGSTLTLQPKFLKKFVMKSYFQKSLSLLIWISVEPCEVFRRALRPNM